MKKDDCLRQCLARLLRLKPGKVPHFVRKHKGRWSYYMTRWLMRRGYSVVVCHGRATLSENIRKWIRIGPVRGGDTHHAVLMEAPAWGVATVSWDGGFKLRRTELTLIIQKARR